MNEKCKLQKKKKKGRCVGAGEHWESHPVVKLTLLLPLPAFIWQEGTTGDLALVFPCVFRTNALN